ncbi:Threonyl- and alanyl-tRNA synthetase second additional domain [Elusimicrobium minutum Pei191]|uniref:Threonyl-and alanyl-tRNA synthetase second additional domain n=1 Tax=Elusimicrobium minutum (strain Pei191) TaxID=445932 RepID=B2KEN7_ELUMP|nr:hypothetical protein [Elusimicrobium minutum]ACC98983.1 Threonyl- and alanyl-tRNA synthetase second additional domain [Elusimicrobium minutum Pei191]
MNTDFTPTKDYFEPMHTAEHILNRTMVNAFGCARSKNAHIEKSKSKCDYFLPSAPAAEQIAEIEKIVNKIIAENLDVIEKFMPRAEVSKIADISKLPESAGDMLRVIFVGDYDVCPCIGKHVKNTAEIGRFKITTWDYENGRLRIRYKLEN